LDAEPLRMKDESHTILITCLRIMLGPLMRFCLRFSLNLQDIVESVKIVLVQAAKDDLLQQGKKFNTSRISVKTGVHRKDVIRILSQAGTAEPPSGLIRRLIGQWLHDARFTTKSGKPRVLSVTEFRELAYTISTDVNPGTVLFELKNLGAIKTTSRGLRLISESYLPTGNLKELALILSKDIKDLMTAVHENMLLEHETPNLHGRTEYDNVDPQAVPAIRRWILRQGSNFHSRMRKFLAKFDRDITPKKGFSSPGVRVSVGTYALVDSTTAPEPAPAQETTSSQ